jgi:hypothetical protein
VQVAVRTDPTRPIRRNHEPDLPRLPRLHPGWPGRSRPGPGRRPRAQPVRACPLTTYYLRAHNGPEAPARPITREESFTGTWFWLNIPLMLVCFCWAGIHFGLAVRDVDASTASHEEVLGFRCGVSIED